MTVGEITAEVESRRASTSNDRETDFDDWTKVDAEIENMVPKAVVSDDEDDEDGDEDDDDDDDDDDEGSSVDEEETLNEEELSLDVDDHGRIRNIMSARRGAFVEFVYS
jgi:mitogen-activated protein kinase kinase kinase